MMSNSEQQMTRVFYGTDINASEVQNRFKQFLNNYTVQRSNGDSDLIYMTQLRQIQDTEVYVLNLDCRHLQDYDKDLYRKFVFYPSEMIPYVDAVVNQMYKEMVNDDTENSNIIQVRPYNLVEKKLLRSLTPIDIDKLISVKGIVIRTSDIVPEM